MNAPPTAPFAPDTAATLDLGVIGNGSFGALLDARARVVWSCLPAFDGDPAFCALLSPREQEGGDFAIELEDFERSEQAYLANTAILRTVLHDSHGGAVEIIDFAPRWREHGRLYRPVSIMRRVTPLSGSPRIRVRLRPLTHWGEQRAATTWGSNHIRYLLPDFTLRLTTDVPVRFVREGTPFVLAHRMHLLLGVDETLTRPLHGFMEEALHRTTGYWREWVRYLSIPFEWQDAVIRAAITLKLCEYEETGGIVAAPTTSLPEVLGGSRNWDYRFCWLRDSAFMLTALTGAGFLEEAAAWRDWLVRAIAGSPDQVQIMYGLAGERLLTETELPWLPGYAGSRPVRIGNGAAGQVQLDVLGEVVDALFQAHRHGLKASSPGWPLARAIMDHLDGTWRRPDHGIWEVRGQPRHFTHSKVMAWAAFDRMVRAAEEFGLDGPVERWRRARDEAHAEVCAKGFDPDLGAFTQSYGSRSLDASLLQIPLVGFLPADDPRVRGTVAAVERGLTSDGLVRRYDTDATDDGLDRQEEGTFLACSFWLVEAMHLQGRDGEARALFERLLALRNDVGLLAEQYDTRAGRQVGNFPQAFSHEALVNAALALAGEETPDLSAPRPPQQG